MSLSQYLLNIIFPPLCLSCRKYLGRDEEIIRRLCTNCSSKLSFMPGFLCPVCFRRLPSIALAKEGWSICHRDAQFILASPLDYSNPTAQELIHTFKYGKIEAAAEPLISVLVEYLSASFKNNKPEIKNFVLIPIPLHPKKRRKRGFNQALIIAERLKARLDIFREITIVSDALFKKESNKSQTEQKDYASRENNVRGSFGLRKLELIAGKNIFLVDDVFTSGATMREAVRVLKSAGAKKIIAITIAKA
ncbi:MAG: ComF family protein [Patescibacteria group bacterium]